jgi:hypothetical protein
VGRGTDHVVLPPYQLMLYKAFLNDFKHLMARQSIMIGVVDAVLQRQYPLLSAADLTSVESSSLIYWIVYKIDTTNACDVFP